MINGLTVTKTHKRTEKWKTSHFIFARWRASFDFHQILHDDRGAICSVRSASVHSHTKQQGQLKQVPLYFALMCRRKKRDYVVLSVLNDSPRGECIVSCTELALWKAMQEILPQVICTGCSFTLLGPGCKIQEAGLQFTYTLLTATRPLYIERLLLYFSSQSTFSDIFSR